MTTVFDNLQTGVSVPPPVLRSSIAAIDLTNSAGAVIVTPTTGYMGCGMKITTRPTAPSRGWAGQFAVTVLAAASDIPVGVLWDLIKAAGPAAAGAAGDEAVIACNGGGAYVYAAGALTVGVYVMYSSGTQVTTATAGNWVIGQTLEPAAAAGDRIAILVNIHHWGT